jgi:hypothetical protein
MTTRSVPLDADGFTAYVADRIRDAMPGIRVDIVGPLRLEFGPPNEEATTVSLARAHDYSISNRAECAEWLEDYVEKLRGSQRDLHMVLDRGMLRIAVRRKAYIDGIRATLGEASKELIFEPLTADLFSVCYVDMPTAMRPAVARDLAVLGLTREEAWTQAKANLAAGLAEFEEQLEDIDEDEIGMIDDDVYASSWLALPDAWSRTAARFSGKLIVSVPAFNVLLYASESEPEDADALREAAEEEADSAEWPLSTSVYRWTPQGWENLG